MIKNTQVRKVIKFFLFISLLLNQANASSTYTIAKAHKIGTSYACLIKEKITNYEKFSSAQLCSTIILEDLKVHNENTYFLSDYLIKHYEEDFTLSAFKNCVITLNLLKKKQTERKKNSL